MTNTTAVQIMTDDITDDTLTQMTMMITRMDGLEANSSGRSLSVGSAYTQQTDYVPSCSTFANNRLAITITIITITIVIIIIFFFLVRGLRTVGSTRMLVKSVSSSRRRDVARSAMPASSLSRGDFVVVVVVVVICVLIVKR